MNNSFFMFLIAMPQGAREWLIFIAFALIGFFLPIWIIYWVFKYFMRKGSESKQ